MVLAFRRRRPPSFLERIDAIALNVLAAAWLVRIVWGLRQGRLPRLRSSRRR